MSKEPNLETASREELVAYIKNLKTSRDAVRAHNKEVTKFAGKVNEAVTCLASDASLVFQAMAEKAGVRGHPSVTEVVRLFDSLMHQQWQHGELPNVEWPTDWDFDNEDDWSGDADMQLNAPIAVLIELLDQISFGSISPKHREAIDVAVAKVQAAMRLHIEGIKSLHGFKKMEVRLSDIPNDVGYALLDLAQDMHFANHMLRRDLRAATYRRVCGDLYALAFGRHGQGPQTLSIYVVGGTNPAF